MRHPAKRSPEIRVTTMNNKMGSPTVGKVISLFEDEEFAGNHTAGDGSSPLDVLESMMANPRLSTPANDEAEVPGLVKLAPQRKDCRQAKLLCMWAEILVESERA